MRKIDKIVVHCSATPDSRDIGSQAIDRCHRFQGWSGIGYHYVIRKNGVIELGRPIEKIGAHVKGANSSSIGICVIGSTKFNEKQFESLRTLVNSLKSIFGTLNIYPHNFFPSAKKQGKTCPNFDVKEALNG